MKKHIFLGAATCFAFSLIAADSTPKDSARDAAKNLAGKSNYSWKTSVEWNGDIAGSIQGKTEKGAAAFLTLARADQSTDAVLKGGKGALKTDDGWKSLADAASENQQGHTRFIARILQNFKAPGAEAEDLVSKVKDLKFSDGLYSGDLTEEGAKSLIRFGGAGNGGPEVKSAKGSVNLWVKDGQISKYEFSLEGTMSINGEDRDVNRKNTVEIFDVGTTKVTVPEEAEKKLS